jgi:hypothetical protein
LSGGLSGVASAKPEALAKPEAPAKTELARILGPRRAGVAASMAGVKAPGEAAAGRQRKRYTQKDLTRKTPWSNL